REICAIGVLSIPSLVNQGRSLDVRPFQGVGALCTNTTLRATIRGSVDKYSSGISFPIFCAVVDLSPRSQLGRIEPGLTAVDSILVAATEEPVVRTIPA